MSGEDIVPTLGLDTTGFDAGMAKSAAKGRAFGSELEAAIKKADAAGKKLDHSIKALDKPIDKAADSAARLRAESEKLEKAVALLGPEIGGAVGMLSKFGKAAGSGIGGTTAAVVGLGAALGVALYGLKSYGAMVANTIENVEDLAASLNDMQRNALAGQIEAVREAKKATDDLGASMAGLEIVLTAQIAPAVSDFSLAMSGMIDHITGADDAVGDKSSGMFGAMYDAATWLLSEEASVLSHGFTDLIAEGWIYAREQVHAYAEEQRTLSQAVPEWMKTLPGNTAKHAAAPSVDIGEISFSPAKPQRGSNRAPSGPAASMSFDPGAVDFSGAAFAGYADAQAFTDAQALRADEIKQYSAYIEHKIALSDKLRDAEIANAEAIKAARKKEVDDAVAGAAAMTSTLVGLGMQLVDAQVANTKEGTEAHRQALRDQLTMQEASAAAQAALGLVNIWSQWAAQPIVAGALTLIEVGATTAAIQQMEAQKSKLHTGGLAPDERYGMPQPITRDNERTAVLTREGQRHLDDLDRINSGAVQGRNMLQVVVRDESGRGRRMSGREFGRPVPGIGQAPRGVR